MAEDFSQQIDDILDTDGLRVVPLIPEDHDSYKKGGPYTKICIKGYQIFKGDKLICTIKTECTSSYDSRWDYTWGGTSRDYATYCCVAADNPTPLPISKRTYEKASNYTSTQQSTQQKKELTEQQYAALASILERVK